jgi:hypothetical protein
MEPTKLYTGRSESPTASSHASRSSSQERRTVVMPRCCQCGNVKTLRMRFPLTSIRYILSLALKRFPRAFGRGNTKSFDLLRRRCHEIDVRTTVQGESHGCRFTLAFGCLGSSCQTIMCREGVRLQKPSTRPTRLVAGEFSAT